MARKADDRTIIQLALFGLGNVAACRGQPVGAARLWGASEAVHEAFDIELSPMARSFTRYEDNLSAARSQLDEAMFEEAWAEGKAVTIEEAIEYAVSEGESASPSVFTPEQAQAAEPMGNLTRREQEVALLVARGLTNRQISTELGISERTA